MPETNGQTDGKLLAWEWDGVDQPIKGGNYKESLDSEEYVDSQTAGDGTESITGRATRSFTADAVIKVGGVAVKALDMKILIAGTEYPCTNITFDENPQEGDRTDGGSGTGTVSAPGFFSRKSKMDYWMKTAQDLPARGSVVTLTLTFTAGVTVVGNFKVDDTEVVGKVEGGEGQKISLSGMWQGDPVVTGLGLDTGVEKSSKIIFKPGLVTDKAVTGNAIIFGKSISADKNSTINVQYSVKYNGDVTESPFADA